MLRLETEFICSDLKFSKFDEKGLIGITSDTFETKYVGQLNYWRLSSVGQLDEIQSVGLDTGGVCVSETSHYDSFLITGHTDPILRLWTLNELRKPIKRYTHHNMSVEDVSVSPFNGNEFVSCSKDSSFAIWDIAESEPIFSANNESSFPMLGVTYHSQNPSLLLAAPLDTRIELWDRQEQKKLYTITPPDDIIFSCMSINPYNEFMLSVGDEQGMAYIWDLRSLKKPIHSHQAHGLAVSQIKFNPHDEALLGTSSTDNYFHLWHLKSKEEKEQLECIKSYKTHTLPITTFDWSLHEVGLACDASSDYSIFLWSILQEEEEIESTISPSKN
ncbi:predicted protein [Naegleria gruberi]|uniref:Peroxin-7 n=1 Tax=Naegleria gruberi TaxID=5762 RepID=D2VD75_NAEGR|nr:uncharacterized protein NAEGRDRAFT_66932 [Naegleria gruberi]EFC45283.1 predicted protein [Naegleria gruberi]|eukprot:XP_002678027.1 predicted protein [Naegleria gruberi strain NEG-M]